MTVHRAAIAARFQDIPCALIYVAKQHAIIMRRWQSGERRKDKLFRRLERHCGHVAPKSRRPERGRRCAAVEMIRKKAASIVVESVNEPPSNNEDDTRKGSRTCPSGQVLDRPFGPRVKRGAIGGWGGGIVGHPRRRIVARQGGRRFSVDNPLARIGRKTCHMRRFRLRLSTDWPFGSNLGQAHK